MLERCSWVGDNELMKAYHDEEWGEEVHDDMKLFEILSLESKQSGLGWMTILSKRESLRMAFDNFNPNIISLYGEEKIDSLMEDKGIIRHRLKITATINNAKRFIEIQEEFGSFDKFIWTYVDNTPIVNTYKEDDELPSSSPLSEKISRDLKKRGFKFIGPTTIYAFMQSMGMVNDHVSYCFKSKDSI